MAQITLGIGNMAPSKLVWEREKKKACRANEGTQLENKTGAVATKLEASIVYCNIMIYLKLNPNQPQMSR